MDIRQTPFWDYRRKVVDGLRDACMFFPALSAVEISFSQIKLLSSCGVCERERIVAGLLVVEQNNFYATGSLGSGLATLIKNHPDTVRDGVSNKLEKLKSVSGTEHEGSDVVFWILCEVLRVQCTADWIGPCYRDGGAASIFLSRQELFDGEGEGMSRWWKDEYEIWRDSQRDKRWHELLKSVPISVRKRV